MKPHLPHHRQSLGKSGENLAATYLKQHGYTIIARNFKARYGEIDIICVKDNVLIFVEVKTRIGEKYGKPEESIMPRKLREVIKTAEFYKTMRPRLPDALRIDVIAIRLEADRSISSFNHITNVTG
jgi:putative endonuclease